MNIDERASIAAKTHANAAVRALGVRDLTDYEPHRRTWAELNSDGREILAEARKLGRVMENMPDAQQRSAGDAVDALLDTADAIEREKDIRSELGNRDPRAHGYGLKVPGINSRAEARGVDMPTGDTEFRAMLRGEQRAMSTTSNPDGGAMVPHQIDQRIQAVLQSISPMRRLAQVVQTDSGDYSKIVSTRGTASGWSDELADRDETEGANLEEIRPPSGELYAFPKVTAWLLQDSAFNVDQFLQNEVGSEFALKEGIAFVSGNGINKPRGVTTYTTEATADASRAFGTIQHVAAAGAAAVTGDELIGLLYTLAPAYRAMPGCAWMMNASTIAAIRKLKSGDGEYIFVEGAARGIAEGTPPSLLGYPVVEAPAMPDMATGNLPIVFGNWPAGYLITDRTGMRLVRDEVTAPGFVKLYFAKRVGGAVTDSNALKFLKMA